MPNNTDRIINHQDGIDLASRLSAIALAIRSQGANVTVDVTNMGGVGGAPIDNDIFDSAILADRIYIEDNGVTTFYELQAKAEDTTTNTIGATFKASILDLAENDSTDQFISLVNANGTRSVTVSEPVAAAINTAY